MENNNVIIQGDGMIHGRFQPYHNGHVQHTKRALKRVPKGNKLYIGITKPFITDNGTSVGDDHRDNRDSNPYTFEQRREMILRSIELDPEITDRLDDIVVIPWSMNNENELNMLINAFFPERDVTQFMNIIPGDGWEYEKEKILQELGFRTVNLVNKEKPRITSATEVRTLKKAKDATWEDKVPDGTRKIVQGLTTGNLVIPVEYNSVSEFLEKTIIKPKDVAVATLPRTPEAQETADEVARNLDRVVEENNIGEQE